MQLNNRKSKWITVLDLGWTNNYSMFSTTTGTGPLIASGSNIRWAGGNQWTNPSPPFWPQPLNCTHFFLLFGVYCCHPYSNVWSNPCAVLHEIIQSAVCSSHMHHLIRTMCVCDWPVIPNIAHPEFAYAEKHQSKKHKEEAADWFVRAKAKALYSSVYITVQAKTQEAGMNLHPPSYNTIISAFHLTSIINAVLNDIIPLWKEKRHRTTKLPLWKCCWILHFFFSPHSSKDQFRVTNKGQSWALWLN